MTKKKDTNSEASNVAPVPHLTEENSNGAPVHHFTTIATGEIARTALGAIEIELPDTREGRLDYVIRKKTIEAVHWLQAGYVLMVEREESSHGEWLKFLDDAELDHTDAKRSIQAVKKLREIPEQAAKKLTRVSKSKLIEFIKLDAESLDRLDESGELDEFSTMSKRQLVNKVKELKAGLESKDDELWVEQQKKKPRPKNRWPEKVLHMREEAAITAMNIGHLADQLDLLVSDLGGSELHSSLSTKDLQGKTEYNAAAQAVYLATVESYRRLRDAVLAYENASHPLFSIERPEEITRLDDSELINAQTLHGLFVDESRQEKEERRIKRTNKAREGKRGRKLGSGKKQ